MLKSLPMDSGFIDPKLLQDWAGHLKKGPCPDGVVVD